MTGNAHVVWSERFGSRWPIQCKFCALGVDDQNCAFGQSNDVIRFRRLCRDRDRVFSGDFPNALNYAERAVKFNPSFTLSNWWLGLIQAHAGKFLESEISILKAFELSPVDPELERIYGALYCSYLGQKRYQEALDASDKALQYHQIVVVL